MSGVGPGIHALDGVYGDFSVFVPLLV